MSETALAASPALFVGLAFDFPLFFPIVISSESFRPVSRATHARRRQFPTATSLRRHGLHWTHVESSAEREVQVDALCESLALHAQARRTRGI